MNELTATFQNAALFIALCGLSVIAAFALLYSTGELGNIVRKWTRLPIYGRAIIAVGLCIAMYRGATKSKFTYDGGIKSNPLQRTYSTNDSVVVHWMRDQTGGVYVPATATVYIDYRLSTDTNGAWASLGSTTVGEWGWSNTVANATNYDYNIWAYYIPPEPVHTNGVWVYKTLKDRADRNPLPLRARIEVNGKAIATPKEVRRDEDDD